MNHAKTSELGRLSIGKGGLPLWRRPLFMGLFKGSNCQRQGILRTLEISGFGCSRLVWLNTGLSQEDWVAHGWCSLISLWPFGNGSQSAANTTRTMIIKTARVDRIAKVNGRGSTLLSGLRLQLPQLLIFRFISRIRPSSIDETQCNEPRQQLFHNAFNDVPLIDTLFGNEVRQSIFCRLGCPKAST